MDIVILGGRAHSIEDAEMIAKAGFPFAEVSVRDRQEFCDSDLAALKQLRDTYGISYLAHGPEEGNAWEPDVLRRELLPLIIDLLDCSRELSIRIFTLHFWIDSRFLDRSVIREKIEILHEMSRHAARLGMTLCLENLSERVSDFSAAFDCIETLGMTLDIGHGELLGPTNTAHEFCRNCAGRIQHIHVHDNRGGDSPQDDLHLPPGEGIIDFQAVFDDLKRCGFDKTMTLEIKPQHLANGKALIERIWNDQQGERL